MRRLAIGFLAALPVWAGFVPSVTTMVSASVGDLSCLSAGQCDLMDATGAAVTASASATYIQAFLSAEGRSPFGIGSSYSASLEAHIRDQITLFGRSGIGFVSFDTFNIEGVVSGSGQFVYGQPIAFSVDLSTGIGGTSGDESKFVAEYDFFGIDLLDSKGEPISAIGVSYTSSSGTHYPFTGATYVARAPLLEPSTWLLMAGGLVWLLNRRMRHCAAR